MLQRAGCLQREDGVDATPSGSTEAPCPRANCRGVTMEPVIFGTHDEKTIVQLNDVASRAERTALMADGHLGYVMPIGGVAAYREQVSVVGVGFDIACGNAAIRTNRTIHDYTRADLELLADE